MLNLFVGVHEVIDRDWYIRRETSRQVVFMHALIFRIYHIRHPKQISLAYALIPQAWSASLADGVNLPVTVLCFVLRFAASTVPMQ